MKLHNIALNNLRRRKAKMAFLTIGLTVGIATIVTLVTLTNSMSGDIERKMDEFGANILITPRSNDLAMSYGGISLAVYMHGVTKEVWRLAKASCAHGGGRLPATGSEGVYHDLLRRIADHGEVELSVMVDILAGASAGGINAVFLAHAIASGHSLDPLTDLWLESADVDTLLDPEVGTVSRFAKSTVIPFAWARSKNRFAVARRSRRRLPHRVQSFRASTLLRFSPANDRARSTKC